MSKVDYKLAVSGIVAALLSMQATACWINPLPQAKNYGIPVQSHTSDYVSVMGTRNLALGLLQGFFTYQGDRKAAGAVMCSALIIGILDTISCYNAAGKMTAGAWSHALVDPLVALAGLWVRS